MSLWTKRILTRCFRRAFGNPAAPPREKTRPTPVCFRPRVHELEDRFVPAGADVFANATVLVGSVATDSGPTDGATAWWQWTAPTSGLVEVNTFESDFDTILGVYTGSPGDVLATNDDAPGSSQSQLSFNAVAGTTYHIAVDGYGGGSGNVVLNIGLAAPNDDFANATTFTGGTVTGGNLLATAQPGEPDPNGGDPLQTVWWQWTAPASGPVEVNTIGSSFDTNLAVFTGSAVNALTEVSGGHNDDYYGLQSRVSFNAVAGTTYHFAVDGYGIETGYIVLNMPTSPAPTNNTPVVISQSFSVNENGAVGTVVGTVAASDPDAGQTLTYAITGGNPGGAFAINPTTGQLTVANPAALDFETLPSLSLTVQVMDSGSPAKSASALVTVNLSDVNEAPKLVNTGPFSIDENSAANTVVGLVTAQDPDNKFVDHQTLTYAIVGGNVGGAFAIDPTTGLITVANSAALNFEALASYALTVQVTDDGSPELSDTTSVPVTVNDLVEAPPVIEDQQFAVNAGSLAGTMVGTVAASDPDAGQTLTYAITGGNASGAFAINPTTGVITVANAAALGAGSVALTVQVTDSDTPAQSASAVVTVVVTDSNQAPVLDNTGSMSLAAVNEDAGNNPGTLVSAILPSAGGMRITDANAGALRGIAVVAADTSHGSWQFSTDNGASWSPLGAVSNSAARLLAADANTRIRFVPAANYSGTVLPGITFRAWDQTTGVNGGTGDASVNGGTSAFSTATETASITVVSARQQIDQLAARVQTFVGPGGLTGGQGNALQVYLGNATKKLEKGDAAAGIDNLEKFLKQVQTFVKTGNLTPAAGQVLIDLVNAAIASAQA